MEAFHPLPDPVSSGKSGGHLWIDGEFQQRNRNYKEESSGTTRNKIMITEKNNAFDGLICRHDIAKEIISEHGKRSIKITKAENTEDKKVREEERTVHSRVMEQYQTF